MNNNPPNPTCDTDLTDVERVARVLYLRANSFDCWDQVGEELRAEYFDHARAAIAAMQATPAIRQNTELAIKYSTAEEEAQMRAALSASEISAAMPQQPVHADVERVIELLRERKDQEYDGECHLTNEEADRIVSCLRQVSILTPRAKHD